MKKLIILLLVLSVVNSQAQNVGIGNTSPIFKLDQSGRMRIRGGADLPNSAGVILGGVGTDSLALRSFVGMATDTSVGFFGYGGAGWAFAMDTRSGIVGIGDETSLRKAGLVVNRKSGAVHAMFGSNTTGVAIESDYPGIGFNSYYDGGRRTMVDGFSGYIGLDPFFGGMRFVTSGQSNPQDVVSTYNTAVTIMPNGNIALGDFNANGNLQFENTINPRKLVLFESANNDHQFSGFGSTSFELRYQTAFTTSDHVFYAGSSSSTSNELMRMKGNGYMGIGVADPQFRLDIKDRMRVRSGGDNNSSAGIYFNNTNNTSLASFVGMQSDNSVGLWGSGNGWGLTMNTQNGALSVAGNPGTPTQVLTSNGSASAPGWTKIGNILQTYYNYAIREANVPTGNPFVFEFAGGPMLINTTGNSRLIISANFIGEGDCGICSNTRLGTIKMKVNGVSSTVILLRVPPNQSTNNALSNYFYDVPGGNHTLSWELELCNGCIGPVTRAYISNLTVMVLPKD